MKNREYEITGCFATDDKKFAFIHIYKNASISIRNAMGIRGKYYEWNDIKQYSPITLCVIRNPYSRIVSSYYHMFKLNNHGFPNKHPVDKTEKMKWFIKKDFNLFIESIEENGFYDAVTLPQYDFLNDRCMKIDDIDEVLVQSRIYEDFDKFVKKYNLEFKLQHENIGNYFQQDDVLIKIKNDKTLKRKIYKIYKNDFILYSKFTGISVQDLINEF